jgi:hypothetical protein
MRAPATADIVRVWELGQHRPNWQRALLLLAPCFPGLKPSELAAFTVGRRNNLLFQLRERVIGPVMQGFVQCPVCREPLEFSATVGEFLERSGAASESDCTLTADGFVVRYRLPDSRDLAAAAGHLDLPEARQTLIRRSIVEILHGGGTIGPAELPDSAVAALADEIREREPLADVRVHLKCAACENVWSASLDIANFFWTELDRMARRLLEDVQALARTYGWPEADILAMSEARRQYYLGAIE